jgi:hypothetical protein
MLDASIEVLTGAAQVFPTGPEQAAIARGLRRLQAQRRYYRARDLSKAGQPRQARLEAMRGPPGTVAVAARLTALAVAPRMALRMQQAKQRRRAVNTG